MCNNLTLPPSLPPSLLSSLQAKFAKWHRGMLERGFYLAPSQYEAGFMSLAHTEADIDATIAAAKEVFKTL
jgi:glutamate-1-semialdehyde 2,1-aminomutase